MISDVHIKETGTLDLRTFQHALTQLNEQAPKQDAFVVVGDLADTGALKEYDRFFLFIIKINSRRPCLFYNWQP